MTTLQEAARNAIMALQEARTRLEWFVDSYPHDVVDKKNFFVGTDAAIESLRTALAQQGEQQPSAYLTIADTGDMVWPPEAYDEACTYCDDDENPVPLYTAAPAPQAQPMTDPCKTCSHFKKGNLPGVRIHDETCYECRSYWGNKWEAA